MNFEKVVTNSFSFPGGGGDEGGRSPASASSRSKPAIPIQIATFDLDEYRNVRKQFTTDEWIDLIVRSMEYEPGEMSRRLKLLYSRRHGVHRSPAFLSPGLGDSANAKSTVHGPLRVRRRSSVRRDEVLVRAAVRVAFISEGRAKPVPKSLRQLMKADLDPD